MEIEIYYLNSYQIFHCKSKQITKILPKCVQLFNSRYNSIDFLKIELFGRVYNKTNINYEPNSKGKPTKQ